MRRLTEIIIHSYLFDGSEMHLQVKTTQPKTIDHLVI